MIWFEWNEQWYNDENNKHKPNAVLARPVDDSKTHLIIWKKIQPIPAFSDVII